MINLNISQNNEITKSISDILVEYLYNLSKSLDNNVPQYMKGRLEVPHGYADAIAFLEGKFNDLRISSINGAYIRFKDYNVQSKLANNYGDGVGLTTQQAASLSNDSIFRNLFLNDKNITSFDELSYFTSMNSLSYQSFEGCSNLTSIDLKYVNSIGHRSFMNCSKLTTLKNYQNVRSFGYGVFNNCDLTGDFDFSNATESQNNLPNDYPFGFSGNKHLTSVVMPNNVQYLCSFQNCENITSITGLDNVKYMGYGTFCNCYKLENVSLPNLETAQFRVFEKCNAMTSINLPKLTSCDYSFVTQCENLIEFNAPLLITESNAILANNTKLETVTLGSMGVIPLEMLYNAQSLTTINMNLTIVTEIKARAFRNCRSLTSLSFPNVTKIGDEVFTDCVNLTSLNMPKLEESGGNSFSSCAKLTSLNLPLLILNSNNRYLFQNCTGLQEITLSSENTIIPEKLFYNCQLLTTINGIDWTKITSIGDYALHNLISYTNNGEPVEFSSLTTLGSTGIGSFSVPTVKFPVLSTFTRIWGKSQHIELNTNITELPNNCMGNTTNLLTVSNLSNVTSIGNECFRYNSNMQTIDCSNKLKTIGNYAFDECINLTSISSDKIYPTSLGTDAFKNCLKLEFNIDLSQCTSIGGSAFYNCQKLTSIGSFSSELTSIGAWAFYNCGLTGNLDIPASVTTLGDGCFRYLQSLTSITFNSDVPPTTPTGTQFNNSTYIIYVPANVINDYKSSFPGEATSRIQAKP